jgi:small subunit ribosomal protein S21
MGDVAHLQRRQASGDGNWYPKTSNQYRNRGDFPLAEVHVHDGESLESALKRFKRKVLQEDIIKEIKRHAFYLKPGQKKRVKEALARKRNRKKRSRDGDSGGGEARS